MENNQTAPLDDPFQQAEAEEAEQLVPLEDEETLKTTAKIYAPLFLGVLLIFCWARRRFTRTYNVRGGGWLKRWHCALAQNQHGFLSWAWKLSQIEEDEFLAQTSMDALCLLRAQRQGLKLSLWGIFAIGLWLLPVYATGHNQETDDRIVRLTVSHIPKGSLRLLGTVLAAYLLYGYAMYLILQEFKWFTAARVRFLVQSRQPRNFTVYVSNIRHAYRSDDALARYFGQIFSPDQVLEAHVAVAMPKLEQKVEARRALVEQLEHAINLQQLTGKEPSHRIELLHRSVNSIEVYTRELEEMNQEIAQAIDRLELLKIRASAIDSTKNQEKAKSDDSLQIDSVLESKNDTTKDGSSAQVGTPNDESKPNEADLNSECDGDDDDDVDDDNTDDDGDDGNDNKVPELSKSTTLATASLSDVLTKYNDKTTSMRRKARAATGKALASSLRLGEAAANLLASRITGLADGARSTGRQLSNASKDATVSLIPQDALARVLEIIPGISGLEDGEPLSGGFVTFKTLSAVTMSKQMLHSNTPFEMEVQEAPTPEGIVWGNVGRSHESVQMGRLVSLAITATLCLFWTVPVSFISSLTELDPIKRAERTAFMDAALEQLAPILLWILTELLYVVLDIVVKFEGHVGASALEASLFAKLSAFHIIQTFFVASIAGSLPSSFWEVAKNLQEFITYLAISLPPQSTFFIQYMLVSTIIGLLFEMLRITQIWQDQIRKRVWWNLTDKEANKKFKFLRPLGDPRNFFHARVFAADTMLLYMIGFVYTPLAPITCYFLAFCFFVQEIAFRHQFIYIYPTTPDSGGRLWLSSVQVLIVCMLSGEITLCVYLILKQAPVAAPMMVPLIITTILFAVYIHQRHFRVARSLSMEDCLHYDQINTEEGMNFDFVEGKYRNPALAHRTILPDNLPSRQIPDVSEAASRESKSEKAEIMGDALDASARSDELVG